MIIFDNIHHRYSNSDKPPTLAGISFEIRRGECVGLSGPSGCGKSTLAGIAAGFIRPEQGRIVVDGLDLTRKPSRNVFLIHQENDLFPWQKVRKQIVFAMGTPDHHKADELISLVKLDGCENFYPSQLSGGMKKRLALARALAINPKLLILDESFSSLDSGLKKELHEDIQVIWEKTNATILLITHNSRDLENLANREVRLSSRRPTVIKEIVEYNKG